jgi:transcription antitermination factor NusG
MIDSNSPEFFYTIYTKAGKEREAAYNLERQGAVVFAPYTRNARRESRPAFPRYIFAAFDLERLFAKLRSTRGVSAMVRFGDEFAQVDRDILLEVMRHSPGGFVSFKDIDDSPAFKYAVGEILKVTYGRWIDSIVKVTDYDGDAYVVEPHLQQAEGFNTLNLSGLLRDRVIERHLEPASV